MDLGVISVRYARALLKSATQAKLEEQVYREMLMQKQYVCEFLIPDYGISLI